MVELDAPVKGPKVPEEEPEAEPEPKPQGFVERLLSKWWLVPLLTGILAIVASVWVIQTNGIRPILFAVPVALFIGFLIWKAIKVYYTHLLIVNCEPGGSQLEIDLVSVPVELFRSVKVEGPTVPARDGYGRPLMIVREFDEDTLRAKGTEVGDYDYLHMAAHLQDMTRLLEDRRDIIKRYGLGKYSAAADLAKDWGEVAHHADSFLQLMRAYRVSRKSRKVDDNESERT